MRAAPGGRGGRAGHARLLLDEEAHRLAEVGAGAAAEGHDDVDAVAPGLQHGLLHERARGRGDSTSAKVDASVRPSAATTASPSGEPSRPAVVTSSARRAPIDLRQLRQRVERPGPEDDLLGERGVGPGGGPASARGPAKQVVVPVILGHAVADEPLVCRRRPRSLVGHRQEEASPRRSGWRGPPSTPASASRSSRTSTVVVMTRLGPAEGARPGGRRGPPRAGWRPPPPPACIMRRRWSRFIVASKTSGVPASSAARTPTRWTWMWSGWP